jgi:hypothetical protein
MDLLTCLAITTIVGAGTYICVKEAQRKQKQQPPRKPQVVLPVTPRNRLHLYYAPFSIN